MDETVIEGSVVPVDRGNLPGMGPLLSEFARGERTWSPGMGLLMATKGADALLDEVTDDLLEGCGLKAVAERMGVKVGELARFLGVREIEYRAMMRVKADLLAHETLGIADAADMEDVAVAKLRIDTRFKLASKWDKTVYGDEKAAVKVDTQITIVHSSE